MSAPETIGRLRRMERLGSGGFATVWRYHDLELDSDVAVKALADIWTSRLDIRDRFLEEARILRRADSDHVVRVYDIGETDSGTPYFVMSYADRGTVADLLDEGPRPTVAESVELVRQAGAGLSVLHRAGIIHRDIKPQNLLLRSRPRSEGPGFEVLVADLGVAKATAHASGLTQVVGTPAYIAPEQALGTGLDVRADVHSLGAVTYVLLTGRLVRDDGIGGLLDARLPPAPSTVADVPEALDPVVLRALEPDPANRWPDVDSFVDALTRAAAGEDVPEALERPAHDASARAAAASPTSGWRVALVAALVLVATFVASYFLVSRLVG
ncbi:MAG TPA: serine/threonine-protein kinase [Marmoricola sp.]|nr:serine/threonine-protein kinase [Marmoricola sp.]